MRWFCNHFQMTSNFPRAGLSVALSTPAHWFWMRGLRYLQIKLGGAELGLKIWDKLMRLAWVAIEGFGFEVERVDD
jgi:hypothetical protein